MGNTLLLRISRHGIPPNFPTLPYVSSLYPIQARHLNTKRPVADVPGNFPESSIISYDAFDEVRRDRLSCIHWAHLVRIRARTGVPGAAPAAHPVANELEVRHAVLDGTEVALASAPWVSGAFSLKGQRCTAINLM